MAYLPVSQSALPLLSLVVRTAAGAPAVATAARAAVRQLDPDLPVSDVGDLAASVDRVLGEPRLRAVVLSGFAGAALLLSALGVYGLLSYSVGQRTREMGIRLALGAEPFALFRELVTDGLGLASWGIGLGVAAAFGLARLLGSNLYAVSASDPRTFAGVAALLGGVALVACVVPARRVLRIDPVAALQGKETVGGRVWENRGVHNPGGLMRPTLGLLLTALIALPLLGGCRGEGSSSPASPTLVPTPPVVTLVNVDTSVDVTAGYTGTWNWPGQSVTMPAGTGYNNIRFNWYTRDNKAAAFGTLYVLDREYLGLPGDLGPTTPGFVARSESITDDTYVFASGVTLTGGAKYWFYGDTQGAFVASFDVDTYAAGDLYVTGYPTYPFHKVGASGRMTGPNTYVPPPAGVCVDANFRLQGSGR